MSVLATKGTSWLMILIITILSWVGIDIDKAYEAYIIPANSTLTVLSEDGGETVYTAGQRVAKSTEITVGSTFTDGEYKYILSSLVTTDYTSKQWGATVIDKTKTSYADLTTSVQSVKYHKYSDEEEFFSYSGLFSYPVTSVNFNNCVNMTALPRNLFNGSCRLSTLSCVDCKSLTSVGKIPESVVSLAGTFVGCENLVTPPTFSKYASYPDMTGAFENCPKIVFPDGYIANCISYTLVYSKQNNEWQLNNKFFNSNLVQSVLNQMKLREYKYAGITMTPNGMRTSYMVSTNKQAAMTLSFDISNPDNSYWHVDVNGCSATEIESIEKYWAAEDNVFCGYKVVVGYSDNAIVALSDTLSIRYNAERNVFTISKYEGLSDLDKLNDLDFKYGDCLIDASDMKDSYEYCTYVFRQNLSDLSKSYIEVSVASEYNGEELDLQAALEIVEMFAEEGFKIFGYEVRLGNLSVTSEYNREGYILTWSFIQDTSDWQKSYWSVTAMSNKQYWYSQGQYDEYNEIYDGLDLSDACEIVEIFVKSEFKLKYYNSVLNANGAFDVRLSGVEGIQKISNRTCMKLTFVQDTTDWNNSHWKATLIGYNITESDTEAFFDMLESSEYQYCDFDVKVKDFTVYDSDNMWMFCVGTKSYWAVNTEDKSLFNEIDSKKLTSFAGYDIKACALIDSSTGEVVDEYKALGVGTMNTITIEVYGKRDDGKLTDTIGTVEFRLPSGKLLTRDMVKTMVERQGYDVDELEFLRNAIGPSLDIVDEAAVVISSTVKVSIPTSTTATVKIKITIAGTYDKIITMTLTDGETLTWNAVKDAVQNAGYSTTYAIYSGIILPTTVKGGNTYNLTVDVE